jgi:hypothetical protein
LGVPLTGASLPKGFIEGGTTVDHGGSTVEQQQQQKKRFRGISLEVGDAWSAAKGEHTGRSINLQLSTAAATTAKSSASARYVKVYAVRLQYE